MIRRIFSFLAIAFLVVTTFVAVPASAQAEGFFQKQDTQQPRQEQYSQNSSPNNDQGLQDSQYQGNSSQNFQSNQQEDQEGQDFNAYKNNQSNQDKAQNQQQS